MRRLTPRFARAERFGAIFQLTRPRALVFTDRKRAKYLAVDGGPLWAGKGDGDITATHLSAPLEAHIQLTNHCDVGCRGCYTSSTSSAKRGEWGLKEWLLAVDELADMGVFHLALGGGESATLPWLGQVAAHAHRRGLIANLTTSGLAGLHNIESALPFFGQINVSIDGLGKTYERVRGVDGFARADQALRRLRQRKREIGINVVVTRVNYAQLPALFAYAKRRRLNEIELLRFKPAGRGKAAFQYLTCSSAQHRHFLPMLRALARRYRLRVRVDCSYTPMIAYHNPGPELLRRLSVYGCTAGDFLIGAKATGQVTGCSFAPPDKERFTITELRQRWHHPQSFAEFRDWRSSQEPCQSCAYHSLCRGGCKVVSLHLHSSLSLPDPECPKVVDYRAQKRIPLLSKRHSLRVI